MDDEDVERILKTMEHEYGSESMELAAKYGRFRQVLVRGFLYGSKENQEKRISENKRATFTWKQYTPLSEGIKEEYGNGEDDNEP